MLGFQPLGGTWLGEQAYDLTIPGINLDLSSTVTRISAVTGKNTTVTYITSDESFTEYKIKSVPSSSSPHTAGTLLETGGAGTAGVPLQVDVTAAELTGAGLSEGDFVIKVFVKDSAGNWST